MVAFEFQKSYPLQIEIDFWQTDVETSKAKPRGYDGAVFIWHIGDDEPKEPENYLGHTMASKRPFRIEFKTQKRGKRVWFRAAWQNERGLLGAFCPAQMTVIP
jgi:hypothetical protein